MVDALNRKMHVMLAVISTRASYLKDRIKEENNMDEFFQQVKACLQQHGTTHNFELYKLEDGKPKYKNKVYIPNLENVKKFVLKEIHGVPYVGHYGCQKTIAIVKKDYL